MRITVRDLMTPAVTAGETASVAAARSILLRWNATELFVVAGDGRLLGVVPDYEFLKAELTGLPGDAPITDLLCTKVETADADADVSAVVPKLRESWCGRIAVIEDGRLIGRIGRGDVLRLVVHLRQVSAVTEAVAERRIIAEPHFQKRERLAPVRKLAGRTQKKPTSRRKVRRLAS